jgi:hypothetical protein
MQEGDRQQLDRVVALVWGVLGPNVVGAYLFGSAVGGGLRPRSDLDVLVVSERALTRDEKRELVDRILPISWRQIANGVLRGIDSKDAAASWALERLPDEHKAVLARARAIYLGDDEDRWEDVHEDVRRYADHVVAEIRRLYRRPDAATMG